MSTIPYESQTQDWDTTAPAELPTPGRRRRRFFNRKSAALAAAITCAAGFYAGVGVEKGQLASAATTTTTSPAQAGETSQGSTATGSGARAGFPGAARGGANASIGTVSSVNGKTIYLTDTTGNNVKVTLSSATKITKSESVSKASLRPGDAVVIQGAKSSSGTITATSVSDSGASATRSGPATTGSSTTSTTNTGTAD